MGDLIYAIGDIHGDLPQLLRVHDWIKRDLQRNEDPSYKVIHIGDLVDRRADSKGVIEHLLNGINSDEPWVCIKGNHDRLFSWFLQDPKKKDPRLREDYTWLHERMGGRTTLASYGITVDDDFDLHDLFEQANKHVPAEHREFLTELVLSFETDNLFFCHAGVRPNVDLQNQEEEDLLWIRNEFLNHSEDYEKLIIHGHTPVKEVTHYGNRINIDTGAAWGHKLSAIVRDHGRYFELLQDHRRELVPVLDQA